MSTKEKEIARSITEAVSILPEEKREYILGYAEGVLAMADRGRSGDAPSVARESEASRSRP